MSTCPPLKVGHGSCRRAAVEAAGAQCGRGTFSVLVCACCLLVMTSVELTVMGRRCLAADGRMDRGCLPISNCAGDARLSTGVERYSSRAKRGSLPSASARERMFFAVWTVFSARPLDCGYPGLKATCRKSQEAANATNSSAASRRPLPLTTVSGMSWRAKWPDSFLMASTGVAVVSSSTWKNRL